jgi:hypothetical protein
MHAVLVNVTLHDLDAAERACASNSCRESRNCPGWSRGTGRSRTHGHARGLHLKAILPPSSGKGAATLISVIPGYQSGQRLASLKSAMVSCVGALIWTLRCDRHPECPRSLAPLT